MFPCLARLLWGIDRLALFGNVRALLQHKYYFKIKLRLTTDTHNLGTNLKGATSRMVHLEINGHFFQVRHSQSVLIHPQPSLFLFGLLSHLWCFSTLVNYYFENFFNLKRQFCTLQKWLKISWHSIKGNSLYLPIESQLQDMASEKIPVHRDCKWLQTLILVDVKEFMCVLQKYKFLSTKLSSWYIFVARWWHSKAIYRLSSI